MTDPGLFDLAYSFATLAHQGQKRKYTGANYIDHPRRVARRVAQVPGVTEVEIAAALLHDVIEDCGVSGDDLRVSFGWAVTTLVLELTNPSKGLKESRAERKRVDREHLKGVSRWAKMIKLIDRTDNLREMDAKGDPDFAKLYAGESQMLLDECLRGVGPELENELELAIIDLKVAAEREL